jgi:predicted outer membrane repeat protein
MRAFKVPRGLLVSACVAMSLSLLMASGASAAERKCVVVNGATDQSYGKLQEAVDAVPEGGEATLSVSGTCYGDTSIYERKLTIAGRDHAVLNGGNSALNPGIVLSVGAARTSSFATLTDLTITGGYHTEREYPEEAGILNLEGYVTLNDSAVTGNTGGGIGNGIASITLNNSTVAGNTTSGNGGGIWNGLGDVTLNNSTVAGNSASGCGGGLFNLGAPAAITLNDSSVTRNTSGNGGGACLEGEGFAVGEFRLTMNGSSSVSRNTAAGNGGGVYNEGGVRLNDSASVTRNTAFGKGGGIYNHQTKGATITYGTGWKGAVSGNLPDNIFNF